MGFNDATGKPVHTELRRAWENGGVFLCDEIDAGNANVLATLNALLSQPIAAFPDGMVARHQNFAFLAAGNTTGAGADMKFVGRNQLDGATLDRFVFVFWEYDEDFEVHVAGEDMREWTVLRPEVPEGGGYLRGQRKRRVRHTPRFDQRSEGTPAEASSLENRWSRRCSGGGCRQRTRRR